MRTNDQHPTAFPRSRTFGTAATSVGMQLRRVWTRESAFRFLLSLLLAVALWLFVTGRQDPAVLQFGQPLQISTANVPTNLVVANNLGAIHVFVRLEDRSLLITSASFHTFVNVQNLRPGTHPKVPVVVVADPGIKIVQIKPANVAVVLEKRLSTHVPVRYHILDPPPGGYSAGDVSAQPSTVAISGPASLVSQITQAGVYLYLAQARSSVEGSYKLSLQNSQGQTITGDSHLVVDPPQVQVVVPIHSVSSYKTLPVLVQLSGHVPRGYGVSAVTVDPTEITAHGLPSRLGRITVVRTAAVSLSHRGKQGFTAHVRLHFARGIRSHIQRVTVSVQLVPISGSSSIPIGVAPVGVSPGISVKIHPAAVLVTVVGPASHLQVAGRHMQATVNLAGYGAGTYQLTPIVQPPPGFRVEGVYPPTVTVILTPSQ